MKLASLFDVARLFGLRDENEAVEALRSERAFALSRRGLFVGTAALVTGKAFGFLPASDEDEIPFSNMLPGSANRMLFVGGRSFGKSQISLRMQASRDGVTWHNLGPMTSAPAGSGYMMHTLDEAARSAKIPGEGQLAYRITGELVCSEPLVQYTLRLSEGRGPRA